MKDRVGIRWSPTKFVITVEIQLEPSVTFEDALLISNDVRLVTNLAHGRQVSHIHCNVAEVNR